MKVNLDVVETLIIKEAFEKDISLIDVQEHFHLMTDTWKYLEGQGCCQIECFDTMYRASMKTLQMKLN